jgi:hypothetical protein
MTSSPEYRLFLTAKFNRPGIEFQFNNFEEWYRVLGPRPTPGYSVDRKTSNGPYGPGANSVVSKNQAASELIRQAQALLASIESKEELLKREAREKNTRERKRRPKK